jgi:hypothetical protein
MSRSVARPYKGCFRMPQQSENAHFWMLRRLNQYR